MSLVLLFLALLTIAVSAYFLPQNALSGKNNQGVKAQRLEPKEGNGGEDAKTQIPISVNYHLTRQCNYSCGSSRLPLIQKSTLIVILIYLPFP